MNIFKKCMLLGALSAASVAASASFLEGGDASSQADADSILDIVFVIDTSGSMRDDIDDIGTFAQDLVTNLECPDIDVWVRATFMGITGTRGIFDQTVRGYVQGLGETPLSNSSEDNGPAVTDLATYFNWNDDSTAGQDYFKAIVTIGDEGTENGYPVTQADWDAAYLANQTAIAEEVLLFSLVTDPYPDVPEVFGAMATGGTGGGYTFGDAGGTLTEFVRGNDSLRNDVEAIICTAAGGGTGGNDPCDTKVPEPATTLLFALGLVGLAVNRRFMAS